ncbi:MAG: GAF domain-containing sensor histidine kinase [Candidatus Eremiobacteraeota bacterium]|nr:GAF domain-containing sensor histidine kinase [Candidatus Eremiobacteraeota bacterium]
MGEDYIEALLASRKKPVEQVQKPPAVPEDLSKLEQQKKFLEARFDCLIRVISLFGQSASLEDLLRILVSQGQILVPFEALELMKMDESEEHLVAYSVCYEGIIQWGLRLNYRGTEMEDIVKERRISRIGNIHEEPEFPVSDIVHIYKIVSILQIPVASPGRFWGFLNLYHRKPSVFTQAHLEVTQLFCALLASFFENELLNEKVSLFKQSAQVVSEPDYAMSLYLKSEVRALQERIVEKCQSMGEKGMGKLTTKQEDAIKDVREAAELAQRRIDHLNEYVLLTGGQVYLERRKVDLARSLADAQERIKAKIDDKSLRIFVEIDKKFPQVVADYKKLQRILVALLENAVEASKAGSLLRVNVSREGDMAAISVCDYGDEINPLDFEAILAPYGKIEHTASTKHGKIILNVPVTKILVELHGGKMWIESSKEEGTAFCFTLPLAPA